MEGQGINSHILDESYLPPNDDKLNEAYVSCKKDDSIIRSWISGTLTEEVLYIVSGLSIAKLMWKALEEVLAQDTKDRQCSLITVTIVIVLFLLIKRKIQLLLLTYSKMVVLLILTLFHFRFVYTVKSVVKRTILLRSDGTDTTTHKQRTKFLRLLVQWVWMMLRILTGMQLRCYCSYDERYRYSFLFYSLLWKRPNLQWWLCWPSHITYGYYFSCSKVEEKPTFC